MSAGLSIDDILVKIDKRLESLRLTDISIPAVSLDPLSEIGLYISHDSLLADLYRQYLEAQKNYIQAIKAHGDDAPMTEIASDMSESAFSAMETRLIELREEEELSDRVLKLQAQQRETYIETVKERKANNDSYAMKQPQAVNQVHNSYIHNNTNTNQDMSFWALLALSFLQEKQKRDYYQEPVANDFMQAVA